MEPYLFVTVVIGLAVAASQVTTRHYASSEAGALAAWPVVPSAPARERRWTYFDYIAVTVLISFSALRFQVGTDYFNYFRSYLGVDTTDWGESLASSDRELGFTFLSLALRSVSDFPYLIFWATAALTVIPVYATLKKQSADLTLSVLLYILLAFFVGPFNLVRQGIAVALNFWANSFLGKNNTAFVLINAVAALFHSSALLAAVLQVVCRNWRLSFGRLPLVLAGGAAAAVAITTVPLVSAWVTQLIPRYAEYVGENAASTGFGAYLALAANLGLLVFAFLLGPTPAEARWVTFVAIGIAFRIVGTQSIIVSRMEDYFGIFVILLLPNLLARLDGRPEARASKMALIALAGVYFVVYVQNYSGLVPYQTYLDW